MKTHWKRAQKQHQDKNSVHFATCAFIKPPYRQTQPSQHFHRGINNPVIAPVTTKAALQGGGLCKFHIEIPDQSGITDPEKSHVTVWGVEALSYSFTRIFTSFHETTSSSISTSPLTSGAFVL